jgi:hypothetical protein
MFYDSGPTNSSLRVQVIGIERSFSGFWDKCSTTVLPPQIILAYYCSLPFQCSTTALPLFYHCFTTVQPLFYHSATITDHYDLLFAIFTTPITSGRIWTIDLRIMYGTSVLPLMIITYFIAIFTTLITSGRIWTIDLRIMRRMFYHCATTTDHSSLLSLSHYQWQDLNYWSKDYEVSILPLCYHHWSL